MPEITFLKGGMIMSEHTSFDAQLLFSYIFFRELSGRLSYFYNSWRLLNDSITHNVSFGNMPVLCC